MASGGGGRYRGCGLATSCRYGRRRRSDFIGYWQRRDVGKTAMAGIFRRTQNGIGNNVHPRRLPHLFGINHRRQTGNSGANHSLIRHSRPKGGNSFLSFSRPKGAGIQHSRESAHALAGAKAGILLRVLPSRFLDNRYAIMLDSRPAGENDGSG